MPCVKCIVALTSLSRQPQLFVVPLTKEFLNTSFSFPQSHLQSHIAFEPLPFPFIPTFLIAVNRPNFIPDISLGYLKKFIFFRPHHFGVEQYRFNRHLYRLLLLSG
jgi:hypothetical protein